MRKIIILFLFLFITPVLESSEYYNPQKVFEKEISYFGKTEAEILDIAQEMGRENSGIISIFDAENGKRFIELIWFVRNPEGDKTRSHRWFFEKNKDSCEGYGFTTSDENYYNNIYHILDFDSEKEDLIGSINKLNSHRDSYSLYRIKKTYRTPSKNFSYYISLDSSPYIQNPSNGEQYKIQIYRIKK